MKSLLVMSLVLSSAVFADVVKPVTQASPVHVAGVQLTPAGRGRAAGAVHVTATAAFFNRCSAPLAGELVQITQVLGRDYDTLNITLGSTSQRVCPQSSVVGGQALVTFDLGTHVRPNDGTFRKVLVNGVEAK